MTCVVDTKTSPPVFVCWVCKETAPFPLPMRVEQMAALTRQFVEKHRLCQFQKQIKSAS